MQHYYSRKGASATFSDDTGGYGEEPGVGKPQDVRHPPRTAKQTRAITAVQPQTRHSSRGSHVDDPASLSRGAGRYDVALRGAPLPPGSYVRGDTLIYAAPPGAHQGLALPDRRQSYTEVVPVPQRPQGRGIVHVHWLFLVGIALMMVLTGWVASPVLGAWWQTHQDDSAYGNPRLFQADAVVGHGDSDSNPSHFIALNLKGDIVVIEIPGGNAKKMISYPITTLPGNQGNPPVKLVFQDLNHDGKIDMLVQIGDPPTTITFMLFNNGTQFVGKLSIRTSGVAPEACCI